ncbi:MAG: methyltransferase domain-containing protein [Oscillospiraceae bacterium]|nr:methyltransferase domain-containing protein [Oscillospiraceae bacterium]
MNEATQADWDAWSDEYFSGEDRPLTLEAIKKEPHRAFPREAWGMLNEAFPDFTGKKVLVPSCGNGYAVYAFHLLGAEVTASDLSSQQLKNASRTAREQGWDIPFIQADSMTLEGISGGEFDLIHTSNGAHVWIGDLPMMYGNFRRVLKPGGMFIFFEIHPFQRPFKDGKRIKVIKPYTETRKNEIEFHWRVEDFIRALLRSGFSIEDFRELMPHEDDLSGHMCHYDSYKERDKDKFARYDWRKNPWRPCPPGWPYGQQFTKYGA